MKKKKGCSMPTTNHTSFRPSKTSNRDEKEENHKKDDSMIFEKSSPTGN